MDGEEYNDNGHQVCQDIDILQDDGEPVTLVPFAMVPTPKPQDFYPVPIGSAEFGVTNAMPISP